MIGEDEYSKRAVSRRTLLKRTAAASVGVAGITSASIVTAQDDDEQQPDEPLFFDQFLIAYEDLSKDNPKNDWDYNDGVVWCRALLTRTSLTLDIGIEERLADNYSNWELTVPSHVVGNAEGEWQTTEYLIEGGEEKDTEEPIEPGESFTPYKMIKTADDVVHNGNDCPVDQTQVRIECHFPVKSEPLELEDILVPPHGDPDELFIHPRLSVEGRQYTVGDPQLLIVPTDWAWPTNGTHLADAYEGVGRKDEQSEHSPPDIPKNTEWYKGSIENNTKTCPPAAIPQRPSPNSTRGASPQTAAGQGENRDGA